MEPIFDHLRTTVRDMLTQDQGAADRAARYVEAFHADSRPQGEERSIETGYPAASVLKAADWLLKAQSFDTGAGADLSRGALSAQVRRNFGTKPAWLPVASLRREWSLAIRVEIKVAASGTATIRMAPMVESWVAAFGTDLKALLARSRKIDVTSQRALDAATGGDALRSITLAPGAHLDAPFTGTLRDYSGCATDADVEPFHAGRGGVLPLGRHAFATPEQPIRLGAPLFLAPMRTTGARREHQGALICAPQNAGKTELMLRWAHAANAAGYNLLIVDVKGTMLQKLARSGRPWRGKLYHVTTDPMVTPGVSDQPCHALNFLDGIEPGTVLADQRVRQIVEALLPEETFKGGEMRWRTNLLNWMHGLVHLALLKGAYWPAERWGTDLADVYKLASSEAALREALCKVDEAERTYLERGLHPLMPVLTQTFADLAALLPRETIVPEAPHHAELKGERAEYSYRWMTEHLVSALRPFRVGGLLYDKTIGRLESPQASLLGVSGLDQNLAPSSEQVTIVLAARTQELGEARTMLALALARLQQALFERMRHAGNPALRPVLLLLDETRRIPGFKTNEYVSYAREAEAGCVVVYQSLDQIGNERQIAELLENIGTQVYLGSLTGNTAKHFVAALPTRHRRTFGLQAGGDGASLQVGQEQIPYFSTADLYDLPAGDFPALVYVRDQPHRPPILVSLDRRYAGEDKGR
jgi:hypothetical protein